MILDSLSQADRYADLHPLFPQAFAFLQSSTVGKLDAGIHEIDGKKLFVSISKGPQRGREKSPLESHRKYIDVQFVIEGTDEIGWRPRGACQEVATPYDTEKEVGFWGEKPWCWLSVPAGHFAIFFPEDAHAPLAGEGHLFKAVVKVAIDA
jgi:biofilm protein TabA